MSKMVEGESWVSVMEPCPAYFVRPSRSEPDNQAQEETGTLTSFRTEFYEAYKRQVKIFDEELKEYNNELNVTLLFVSDPFDTSNPRASN